MKKKNLAMLCQRNFFSGWSPLIFPVGWRPCSMQYNSCNSNWQDYMFPTQCWRQCVWLFWALLSACKNNPSFILFIFTLTLPLTTRGLSYSLHDRATGIWGVNIWICPRTDWTVLLGPSNSQGVHYFVLTTGAMRSERCSCTQNEEGSLMTASKHAREREKTIEM